MKKTKYTDQQIRLWHEDYIDGTIKVKALCKKHGVKSDTMINQFKRLGLWLRPKGFRANNHKGMYGHVGIDYLYVWFYNHAYKRRAKRKQLEFALTESQFISLVTTDCFHCGKSWQSESRRVNNKLIPMLTVDRLDSNVGYISSNCVSSCKICNTIKMDLSYPTWIIQLRQILDLHDKRVLNQSAA